MADKTLVGKEYGLQFSEKTLKAWAASNWDVIFNPPQKISRSSRGWFMIVFSKKYQVTSVLQKSCFIDSSPIFLKLWSPTFDTANERLDSIPIWIRMSGLLPHLWNEKCLQAIGNHLGEFLSTYMGFIDSWEMAVARILILLNIREGLKEYLNLTDLERTRVQILDYEGVPFCCSRCHEYGHIIKECKSSSKGHKNP
jgi:hypothetical protein